jgi:hypothetical protein
MVCTSISMKERLGSILSMALFVLLAVYVGFSGLRLLLVLWHRLAGA